MLMGLSVAVRHRIEDNYIYSFSIYFHVGHTLECIAVAVLVEQAVRTSLSVASSILQLSTLQSQAAEGNEGKDGLSYKLKGLLTVRSQDVVSVASSVLCYIIGTPMLYIVN